MKYSKHLYNRRKFLKQAGLATFGLTTMSSSIFKLNSIKTAAGLSGFANDDYKALVCLFQAGGNDSYNMLIPRGSAEYNEYATTRSNLAIGQEAMLPITPLTSDGKQYGVHPSMSGVQDLFNSGKLSFVTNVGPMIQPVTKTEFENGSVPLPLGLFSHSDQIAHWETGRPHERPNYGWGGRLADMFHTMNDSDILSMNISLSGENVFQAGQNIFEFTVNPFGAELGIKGYQQNGDFNQARTELIDSLLAQTYHDMYKKTYVDVIKNARDAQERFQEAIDSIPDFQTEFSNNSVSRSFQMIARIIAIREELGFKRQIFFVRYGGWDHHDNLLGAQNSQLGVVSNALAQFASALEEIDAFNCTLTFTMSEFARTLSSNGNGSDHAWGGNVMAMGGMVKGQELYGSYPSLEIGNPLDLGRGRLIPTLSNDEYFAEMALWFGVAPSDLSTVFPNVGNFYDTAAGTMPVGFVEM